MISEWASVESSAGVAPRIVPQHERRSFLARLPMFINPRRQSFIQEGSVMSPRKPRPGHSFQDKFADLLQYWDFSLNIDFLPSQISPGVDIGVYWNCGKGHPSWKAPLYNITKLKQWCPYCSGRSPILENSFEKTFPIMSTQFHYLKNPGKMPRDYLPKSNEKIWWKCKNGHEWPAIVSTRTRDGKDRAICSMCTGRIATPEKNLIVAFPDALTDFNQNLNGFIDPYSLSVTSHYEILWQCGNGHQPWPSVVGNRTRGGKGPLTPCPYCSGRLPTIENNLFAVYPEVAKEWHPSLNGLLTPYDFLPRSGQEVWWLCEKGHEWPAVIGSRTRVGKGTNCPFCNNRNVVVLYENSLEFKYPELARQWHPYLNGNLCPENVTPGSGLAPWWLCDEGHEWKAVINSRASGRGCRDCASYGYYQAIKKPGSAYLYYILNRNNISSNGYVGITTQKVRDRISNHISDAFKFRFGSSFHEEIRNSGDRKLFYDNFSVHTLCEVDKYEDKLALITDIEGYCIDKLMTFSPHGLNDQKPSFRSDTEISYRHIFDEIQNNLEQDGIDPSMSIVSVQNKQLTLF